MALACITGGKECDGCGRCWETKRVFLCPVCRKPAERVYVRLGNIIGCEGCVEMMTPDEFNEYD